MAGFDKGKIKSRVHSWFNLGFDQGMAGTYRKARPYNIRLASDNIEFLPHACLFSVAAFAVTALFFLITSGCIPGVAVAGAVAALAFAYDMPLILLLVGCVREFLAQGSLFGVALSTRPPLPMASMPAGGFIVLGVLCAVWRAMANWHKKDLKTEAGHLIALQKEGEREP